MATIGATETKRWLVGASGDVPERGRLVVDAGDITIGIYRLDDKLYAYENRCIHQGGPVCQGLLIPRVIEQLDESLAATGMKFDESSLHIVCPWHGFEYSIRTGSHPAKAELRLRAIPVSEENGHVYVTV
jgi:nitrite reductase/ring-hydroxylating ferredoxin subunit